MAGLGKSQWDFVYVDSSAISQLGYNATKQRLLVTFKGSRGKSYEYLGVSRQRWTAVRNASSKGRYINAAIKPNYPVVKV